LPEFESQGQVAARIRLPEIGLGNRIAHENESRWGVIGLVEHRGGIKLEIVVALFLLEHGSNASHPGWPVSLNLLPEGVDLFALFFYLGFVELRQLESVSLGFL